MKNKLLFILILFLIIFLYKSRITQELTEEEIGYLENLVDNTLPAYEKITKTYEESFLQSDFYFLMENAPPECVRYNNGVYYLVYKIENGYFFELPNYGALWNEWRYIDKVYVKDFDVIKKGETTIDDIRAVDEYANYIMFMSSRYPFSIHFTVDGYKLVIDYTKKEGTDELIWVVDKVRKYNSRQNPIYHNLLTIDKELLE